MTRRNVHHHPVHQARIDALNARWERRRAEHAAPAPEPVDELELEAEPDAGETEDLA